MGSGPSARRRAAAEDPANAGDTSGHPVSKPSGPDSSRVVTGLPLRVACKPAAELPATKPMADKGEVFQDVSSIFVVLGASVSEPATAKQEVSILVAIYGCQAVGMVVLVCSVL